MGRGLSRHPQLSRSGIADFAAIILATYRRLAPSPPSWYRSSHESLSRMYRPLWIAAVYFRGRRSQGSPPAAPRRVVLPNHGCRLGGSPRGRCRSDSARAGGRLPPNRMRPASQPGRRTPAARLRLARPRRLSHSLRRCLAAIKMGPAYSDFGRVKDPAPSRWLLMGMDG